VQFMVDVSVVLKMITRVIHMLLLCLTVKLEF